MRSRELAERVALVATFALVLAFVASFVTGLGRSHKPGRAEPPQAPVVADPGTRQRGRVEVLNASGQAGIARGVTDRLRAAGFDVVFYGNAQHIPDSSAVLDRVGNTGIARAVADELGIVRLRTAVDSSLALDVTVILGPDFKASPR